MQKAALALSCAMATPTAVLLEVKLLVLICTFNSKI